MIQVDEAYSQIKLSPLYNILIPMSLKLYIFKILVLKPLQRRQWHDYVVLPVAMEKQQR